METAAAGVASVDAVANTFVYTVLLMIITGTTMSAVHSWRAVSSRAALAMFGVLCLRAWASKPCRRASATTPPVEARMPAAMPSPSCAPTWSRITRDGEATGVALVREDGELAVRPQVPKSGNQCLVPMTSVALFVVPGQNGQAGGV